MTDTSSIRGEMAATRREMAQAVEELEHRATERVHAVKERLDVGRVVREHPWPALGAAVVLGAIVGGSGADRKAAAATASGTKRAARASKDAANGVVEKVRSRGHDSDSVETVEAPGKKSGLVDRMTGA